MSGTRRSAGQLARDRRRVADLYLRGELQVAIAEAVGISQTTVSRDLKALQKEWLASSLVDYNKAKARELAKVDHLERTYHAAWERSCEDAESATRKQKGKVIRQQDKDGKWVAEQPAEVSKTSKGQVGDPRFLQGVQWCIERRCKILGIDAPTKHDLTTKGERLGSISDDERLAAGLAVYDSIRTRADSADNESTGAVDTPDEGAG